MLRFNCHGKPIFDQRFQEAINKWAKAKGVDPEHVFAANGWDTPKFKLSNQMPLSAVVKGQINTSVFEEVEIIE